MLVKLVTGPSLHLQAMDPLPSLPSCLPFPTELGSSQNHPHSRVPLGRPCHWLSKKTSGLGLQAIDPNTENLT